MTVNIECDTGLEGYIDARDIHPNYEMMKCWNCGHEERIGPNRGMRICQNCFMDNEPTDHPGSSTVEGPDGQQYTDYRLLWYGDVSIQEAQELYAEKTQRIRERVERERARDRTVRL